MKCPAASGQGDSVHSITAGHRERAPGEEASTHAVLYAQPGSSCWGRVYDQEVQVCFTRCRGCVGGRGGGGGLVHRSTSQRGAGWTAQTSCSATEHWRLSDTARSKFPVTSLAVPPFRTAAQAVWTCGAAWQCVQHRCAAKQPAPLRLLKLLWVINASRADYV